MVGSLTLRGMVLLSLYAAALVSGSSFDSGEVLKLTKANFEEQVSSHLEVVQFAVAGPICCYPFQISPGKVTASCFLPEKRTFVCIGCIRQGHCRQIFCPVVR